MATYIKIATVTVPATPQASMDFTSIPSTYTDLKIVYSAAPTTGSSIGITTSFNGSTANFTSRAIEGSGSGNATSWTRTNEFGGMNGTTANTFSNVEIYIPNYALTTNNKSYCVDSTPEANATTAYMSLITGLWSNTNALTSISIIAGSSTFRQHSTATLYGISKS